MKKRKLKLDPVERFLSLSDAEKEAEVARFDKPLPLDADGLPGKPLTPAQRKRWDKIQKRLRGRPKIGRGAKILTVSIERGLLEKADAFARQHKLKRSEMVAHGLLRIMKEGAVRRTA